jgi:hypothetical protein
MRGQQPLTPPFLSTMAPKSEFVVRCQTCERYFRSEEEAIRYHQLSKSHTFERSKSTEAAGGKLRLLCTACLEFLCDGEDLPTHNRSLPHINGCMLRGLYCLQCKTWFVNDESIQRHNHSFHDAQKPKEFRCCDCHRSFSSEKTLETHLQLCDAKEKQQQMFSCEPCGLTFPSKKGLNAHLLSKDHKPVKCLGSAKCKRKFKDFPGMIQHLESGACVSKLNRDAIHGLSRTYDTANAITIEGAPPPSLPTSVRLVEELDIDSVDDAIPTSTSMLSTSSNGRGTSSGKTTPTSGGGSSEHELQLSNPTMCPICGRNFSSPLALGMHVASPVHETPIYHCPTAFLVDLGVVLGKTKRKERVFRTLGAMAQHMNAGACTGGKESWEKVMKVLEAKLGGFGFALRLLGL